MSRITFHLDNHSGEALYLQIYRYIRDEIRNGHIQKGDKLPSKRQLSKDFEISQNTVQNAYDQLIAEGYIYSKERSGYYVEDISQWSMDAVSEARLPETGAAKETSYRYDFNFNQVDRIQFPYTTLRKLYKEVIEDGRKSGDILKRGAVQGDEELRQHIAAYLNGSRGLHISEAEIFIGSGMDELLEIIFLLLGKKMVYGIENPGYEKFPILFSRRQMKTKAIDVRSEGIHLEQLKRGGVDVLCVSPSHQFPTGVITPIKKRQQLLEWAYENESRYIIEDDYDSEFKYSGRPIPALKSMDHQDRVIYLGSFSRCLSPGLHLSYFVLPKQLMRQLRKNLGFIRCSVPTIEQKVIARFMQQGHFERHINRMRSLYRKKRNIIMQSIDNSGLPLVLRGGEGGMHIVARMPGMTTQEVIQRTGEAGIKIYPMQTYYVDGKGSEGAFLIGYGSIPVEEMGAAVQALCDCLR